MVVFFDIDGTIIDSPTDAIPQSAIRAVEKLKENGHIAVVNTGRAYHQVDARVKKMAFRGFVCGCGMEILLDGQWLVRAKPDADQCRRVVECSRKFRMQSFYETADGGMLLDGAHSGHAGMLREVERLRGLGFPIHEMETFGEPDFVKFVSFPKEDSDVEGFHEALRNEFDIISREHGMDEIVLKGFSKAGGMQAVLDHLGIDRQDTLAIGDSTNDVTMLTMAAHSVCLGDGTQSVKEICEYVTAPVLEDGIEKALIHYGLI
jgi:Cof subfamily protein (haloacid dehalogenase superfamily)